MAGPCSGLVQKVSYFHREALQIHSCKSNPNVDRVKRFELSEPNNEPSFKTNYLQCIYKVYTLLWEGCSLIGPMQSWAELRDIDHSKHACSAEFMCSHSSVSKVSKLPSVSQLDYWSNSYGFIKEFMVSLCTPTIHFWIGCRPSDSLLSETLTEKNQNHACLGSTWNSADKCRSVIDFVTHKIK